MKNEKKYGILIYRFIMLLSILLILLLIVDSIIFLRTGYFHVFLNFNYALPFSGMEEIRAIQKTISDLSNWYTPVLYFLHRFLFILNIAYFFTGFFTITKKEGRINWLNALCASIMFIFFVL